MSPRQAKPEQPPLFRFAPVVLCFVFSGRFPVSLVFFLCVVADFPFYQMFMRFVADFPFYQFFLCNVADFPFFTTGIVFFTVVSSEASCWCNIFFYASGASCNLEAFGILGLALLSNGVKPKIPFYLGNLKPGDQLLIVLL